MPRPAVPPSVGRSGLCAALGGVLQHERQAPASSRGGEVALRSRVLRQGELLVSEELYLCRQSYGLQLPHGGAWLLLVLRGRAVLELEQRQRQVMLAPGGEGTASLVLTASQHQELTVVQAPCCVLRLRLPPQLCWQPAERELRAALPLLHPMLELLQRAQANGSPQATQQQLAQALQSYCSGELEPHGVQLVATSHDPLDGLLRWLPGHLAQPLALGDLAAAAQVSPRRLQELCHARFEATPMELLRQQRLEALHQQLQDPGQRHLGVAALMKRLQLPDSAATRSAFKQRYGCNPSELRKQLAPAGHG